MREPKLSHTALALSLLLSACHGIDDRGASTSDSLSQGERVASIRAGKPQLDTSVKSATAAIAVVQTNRYTSVTLSPSVAQKDPLSSIVQIPRLPSDVQTVEQGMRYVLSRTGYSLAGLNDGGDSDIKMLYSLPIPDVQRSLGPMTVRDCLAVFAGQAFSLRVDEVSRTVYFERGNG